MRITTLLLLLAACRGGDDGQVPGDGPGDDDDDDATDPIDPNATTCGETVSADSRLGVQPLEQRIDVVLDAADSAWATCTSPSEPDELHLVESAATATEHELVLRGILGDTDYVCTVHAGCGGPT